MQVNGFITSRRDRPTANGGTAYNVEVNGTWYGCGFDDPGAGEGDYVRFDAEQKGKYMNASNIVKMDPPAGESKPKAPVNAREVSIAFQSSRKDAIAMVGVLLQHEVLAYPKTAKQGEKVDSILAFTDSLAARYYNTLQEVIEAGDVTPVVGE
jgi:hypothetical protein